MKVILGGESYTALASGLQEAFEQLGATPAEHRTDSLSAAYKNLTRDESLDSTTRYQALCEHYGIKGTRNNPGIGHENGGVESAHGHLKRRIEQALLIRGSSDFENVTSYQSFINDIVHEHNRRNAKAITIERPYLNSLPKNPGINYTEVRAAVSSSSTITVRKVTYTVPSRLQGEVLQVALYDDRLICHLGKQQVITLSRIYPTGKNTRARVVDYKHVIHSLIRKPQAFRYSQLRDELLPGAKYQAIWEHINQAMAPRTACKLMVGLLYLAATEDCESSLGQAVLSKIEAGEHLCLARFQAQFKTQSILLPSLETSQHNLSQYNQLIPQQQENAHV